MGRKKISHIYVTGAGFNTLLHGQLFKPKEKMWIIKKMHSSRQHESQNLKHSLHSMFKQMSYHALRNTTKPNRGSYDYAVYNSICSNVK